jgi:fluoride exporter
MNIAYLYVALGGALGSVLRFWLNDLVSARTGPSFPWGILIINVSGSFLIGVLAAFTDPDGRLLTPVGFRQFMMIGICGGYTTFSSFSLETLRRLQDGQWFYASANIVLSVVLCLVAVWLGYLLGAMFNTMKGH